MSDENDLPPLLGRDQVVPRRRWRWLLPLLVTLAAASLLGVGVAAVVRDNPNAPERVMDLYLNSVEKGDTTRAYALLCDRFRRDKPFSEFQSVLTLEKQEAGGVTDHKIAQVGKLADGSRVVSYTVRRADGDLILDARLVRERGDWRICGIKTRGRVATTTTVE